MTKIVQRPSPNFDARRTGAPIDMLVLHYTGMKAAEEALARLCDPGARVSSHYTVDEDGTVHVHVAEDKRAWHAGKSFWRGERDVNARSIGIEIVNPGHEFGYRPFPVRQIDAVVALAKGILKRHPIQPSGVVGHSDVAPMRKEDPGEFFPWKRLAHEGIGPWPDDWWADGGPSFILGARGRKVREAQVSLDAIGYECEASGDYDAETRAAVIAFQRRFRQSRSDGALDGATRGLIHAVARLVGGT
jgi:N-acetylmuramoyl-L-alanine amidase